MNALNLYLRCDRGTTMGDDFWRWLATKSDSIR